MSPEEHKERAEACEVAFSNWNQEAHTLGIRTPSRSYQEGYRTGWADGRGCVPLAGRTVRLIPPGTTHMQYGRERRMAIADYLDSPHYEASGWVPVRQEFGSGSFGSHGCWQIWTPGGWK